MLKKTIFAGLILLFSLGFNLRTQALEFSTPDPETGNVSLTESKVINDNFATAGNSVEINGEVKRDLMVAGNTLDINGKIGNNLFAGGNIVTVNNNVEGDIFAGAGTIKINKGVTVFGNIISAGGNLIVNGLVKGKVSFAGGTMEVNGQVDGDISANLGSLVIGPSALVGGKVTYTSPKDAKIDPLAKISGAIKKHNIPTVNATQKATRQAGGALLTLIMALIVGALFLIFFPKYSTNIAKNIHAKFWLNLLLGLITLVAVPLVVIICFALIVGAPVAVILLALYALAIYLSKVFVGLALGYWLTKEKWSAIWSMTLGLAIIVLLGLVPFLNGLTNFVVLLLGLGAVSITTYQLKSKK